MSSITIRFEADKPVTVETPSGSKLVDVCDSRQDIPLLFGCREAVCGTCLLEVLEGGDQISPITDHEREMLEVMAPDNPKARLGCQCVISGNVRIRALN
jgi:2Fe-2S ferredoxin